MQKGIKNIVCLASIFFAFYFISSYFQNTSIQNLNPQNNFLKSSTSSYFQKTHFFVPKKIPNSGTEQNEQDKIENEDTDFDIYNKLIQHNKNFPFYAELNLNPKNYQLNHFSKIGLYIYYHSLKIPFEFPKTA